MRVSAACARRVVVLLALWASILAPSAPAADPGRWVETGHSRIPFEYYQGVSSDPAGNLFFDGFLSGVYRTSPALAETARNESMIPPAVQVREGYNHIGDLGWDHAEGGRLLLPLECFVFGAGNTCGTGSIGVADPATLQWRYYVKLDPADIAKAMWVEVSPDGELLWTSSGGDLLAYRSSDVVAANAAPDGPAIRPARRLVGAVPPSGVTGATFHEGRLFLAGQPSIGPFQVWSVDTETGERQLEIERDIRGESEGLDVFEGLGGILHWQIGVISFRGPPTYGPSNVLVHFVPSNRSPDCSAVRIEPSLLWPPNHKLVAVRLAGATDPDGDVVALTVTGVTQDEPVESRGDRTSPDAAEGQSAQAVLLRAERHTRGDGRIYRIAFRASDGRGGSCSGSLTVAVPRHKKSAAAESAPVHDSFGGS